MPSNLVVIFSFFCILISCWPKLGHCCVPIGGECSTDWECCSGRCFKVLPWLIPWRFEDGPFCIRLPLILERLATIATNVNVNLVLTKWWSDLINESTYEVSSSYLTQSSLAVKNIFRYSIRFHLSLIVNQCYKTHTMCRQWQCVFLH